MKKNIKELREKYISNPPEGMTSEDIRHMSEDDLLDFVAQCKRRNYEIYRVGLLSPGYINETGVWQLGDLESVWEADEPNAAIPAIVYVLSTGVRLVKSFWFTPENELGKRKLLASFPVGT